MINKISGNQENIPLLTSVLSKLMKQRFGKGPENCFISLRSGRLSVYVRNFMTPAEEVLLGFDKINLIYQFRYTVMEKVYQEFAQEARSLMDLELDSFCSDWDYDTNTGIMLLENRKSGENASGAEEIEPHVRERLFERIIQICSEVHKVPQKLSLVKLDANLFVVTCTDVMLHVENILYRRGCWDLLYERSGEIKKSFLSRKDSFRDIFGRIVESIFMAWDYPGERSYIFFNLK